MSMPFFSPPKMHDSDPASLTQFNSLNSPLRLAVIAIIYTYCQGVALTLFLVYVDVPYAYE